VAVTASQAADASWEAVTGYLPSSEGKWMYLMNAGRSVSLVHINLQDGTSESVFQTAGRPSFANDIVMPNGFAYVAVSNHDSCKRISTKSFLIAKRRRW
jgi:hypothetical protein